MVNTGRYKVILYPSPSTCESVGLLVLLTLRKAYIDGITWQLLTVFRDRTDATQLKLHGKNIIGGYTPHPRGAIF